MKNKTENANVENEISAVLQDGVDFYITYCKANFIQKLIYPKGRKFVMYPAVMGTLLKISNELSKVKDFTIDEITDEAMFNLSIESVLKYKDNLINIVAFAIVNQDKTPQKKLLHFLNKNLNAQETLQLVSLVMSQMGVRDFLASMVLTSKTNLMKIVKTNSTRGDTLVES